MKILRATRSIDDLSKLAEVLVLRGVDDEAALSLSIGSATTRLTRLLASKIPRLNIGLLYCALLVITPALIEKFSPATVPRSMLYWSNNLAPYFIYLLLLVSSVACIGMLAIPFAKSVFGRELFWGSRQFDIAVNSAPDVRGTVQIKTIEESAYTRGELRHGLYQNPECMGSILGWIVRNDSAAEWFENFERDGRAIEQLYKEPEYEQLTVRF